MSRAAWWIASLLLPEGRMIAGRFEFPDTTGLQLAKEFGLRAC